MTNKPVVKVLGIEIAVNFYINSRCSETCPYLDSDIDFCSLFSEVLEDSKQRCQECMEKEVK